MTGPTRAQVAAAVLAPDSIPDRYPPADILDALNDLVRAGLVEQCGDEYRLVSGVHAAILVALVLGGLR